MCDSNYMLTLQMFMFFMKEGKTVIHSVAKAFRGVATMSNRWDYVDGRQVL